MEKKTGKKLRLKRKKRLSQLYDTSLLLSVDNRKCSSGELNFL